MTKLIRPRRPILLKLVFLIFVLWTMLGWLRFAGSLTQRSLIGEFFSPGTFWYLVAAGLIWGLIGLPVLWGLVIRGDWTLRMIWVAGLAYPILYWIERMLLWQDPGAQDNWPFMLLLSFAWLGILIWLSRSKRVREFFEMQPEEKEGR